MKMKYLYFNGLLMSLLFCATSFTKPNLKSTSFPFETAFIHIELDSKGNLVSLKDKNTQKEYIPKGQVSALLSIYQDEHYIRPERAVYDQQQQSIQLYYPNKMQAKVQWKVKEKYLTFTLIELTSTKAVGAVVWGPYSTAIDQLIGETVGVVRDREFAIGLQSLDLNTIEGLPHLGDGSGGGFFIEPLPGQKLPDSVKNRIGEKLDLDVNRDGDMPEYVRLYRGSLAVKNSTGSELRLFARNRKIARTLGKDKTIRYVPAIDVDVIGSSIALFGAPEAEALNTIEAIELGEGLPHPVIDGLWIKKSPRVSEAYMLYEGNDMEKCLDYAQEGNFRLVHLGDFFESWGHFGLKTKRFPNGAADIKALTARARALGISLGVHTLTTFTQAKDPYVSPIPSDSLSKSGSSVLARDLGEDDQVVYVKDPVWFKNTGLTHTIKIGKELLSYRKVSDDQPWRLEGVVRGQFRTSKSSHKAGAAVDKLDNDSYKGFLPDWNLQPTYALRLAEVCKETGIDLMDFDGFGAVQTSGQGTFSEATFIDQWYRALDRDRLVGGSNTSHYFWHVFSFMNWGEPWYSNLRESQINYRIENQRYFERNFMPGMLGWFKLESTYRPEEIEWIQARSAAYDAGFLLRIDESVEKSGFRDDFFEAIREWQKARNSKAFSAAQIKALEDHKREFHLEKVTDNTWNLYPVRLKAGNVHQFRRVQTGEPIESQFTVENPFEKQQMKVYIQVLPTEGNQTESISNVQLSINHQVISIDEELHAHDNILFDGKAAYLCDQYWKKVRSLKVGDVPDWINGSNQVSVTSEFSGPESPKLIFDFKFVGKPELVAAK